MMASSQSSRAATLGVVAGVAAASLLFWMKERQKQKLLDDKPLESLLLLDDDTSDECIYLDYNGTTPVYPEVLKAMIPYFTTHYGNPSSSHIMGQEPRKAVNRARKQLLTLLGRPNEDLSAIWFTACGTESDNLAIHVALQANEKKFQQNGDDQKPHIVSCNVEHPAIEGCLEVLEEAEGCTVTYVPVQPDGRVKAQDIINAIQPNTVLVTLMLANNESGALQPVKEVAQHCRQQGILFHTDAAQAVGKVSVNLDDLGDADMVSIVGHKLGAPKGVACLYVRPGCLQEHGREMHNHGVLLIGGGQEFGRRGGTENVPYIVGMGTAAMKVVNEWQKNAKHMEAMRRRLLSNLQQQLGSDLVRANGPESPELRLPNTLSVGIKGVFSGDLLGAIGHKVAASAGATCHKAGASSVLVAMKVPEEFARGTLRLSLGPKTTADDIDRASSIIASEAKRQLFASK